MSYLVIYPFHFHACFLVVNRATRLTSIIFILQKRALLLPVFILDSSISKLSIIIASSFVVSCTSYAVRLHAAVHPC